MHTMFNITHTTGLKIHPNIHADIIVSINSGADKRPLPSNAPPKQAATLEQKRSLQAL